MEPRTESQRAAQALEDRAAFHELHGPFGIGDGVVDDTLCQQHACTTDERLRLHPKRRVLIPGDQLVDDSPR